MEFSANQAIQMMHSNTSVSVRKIAEHCERHHYTSAQIIEYLFDIADILEAQAVAVSVREQLLTTKTK